MPDLTALYRDALATVRDALDIPLAALDGKSSQSRAMLLTSRAVAITDVLASITVYGGDVGEETERLRTRIDQLPVTYRRWIGSADEHPGDCIVCGPGCCSPVLGMHTSCPGPAAGRTVASVR